MKMLIGVQLEYSSDSEVAALLEKWQQIAKENNAKFLSVLPLSQFELPLPHKKVV